MTCNRSASRFSSELLGSQQSIYQDDFAGFLAQPLARLYQNVFSSMEKFDADGDLSGAECYVSATGGAITTAIVFARRRRTVHVLNRIMSLSSEEVATFADTVFDAYPDVHHIQFEGIVCAMNRGTRPFQQYNCTENFVVNLPESVSAYVNVLGKSTKAGLKRYQKKIQTDFSGFRWDIYDTAHISKEHVEEIVSLSASRISHKNKKSSHTAEKTRQLMRLLTAAGSVLVATIDGRVCAGVICTHYAGNHFMHVIAHDSCYDAYRLGKVCLLLSIEAAIARGAREYHLLWGKYEYKFRFLGKQRDYDRLIIYRSRLAMALSARQFITVALRGHGRRLRIWLSERKFPRLQIFEKPQ